jgi:RNA polymerase sigma-70 factor (ECF subfamily)
MHKKSNEEWLSELDKPENDAAITLLREQLIHSLKYALSGRVSSGQLTDFVEDIVQESLLKIIANLDTFRGESQFLTWAVKIAMRLAVSELRRLRWKDVALEDVLPTELGGNESFLSADSKQFSPEAMISQNIISDLLIRIMREELTEKQLQALYAIKIAGMPLEEVAHRMGTTRNALYKLIHDARMNLRARLVEEGYSPQEVIRAFSQR